MLDDLIVYQKTYDLTLWLFPIINSFPQKQRFVLGQQIENEAVELMKEIIVANAAVDKRPILQKIAVRIDLLRMLIRLAKDLKFLGIKHYAVAAEKINEIGRLCAGWTKRFS